MKCEKMMMIFLDHKNEDRAKEGRIAHKMRPKMLAVAAKVKSFKKGA